MGATALRRKDGTLMLATDPDRPRVGSRVRAGPLMEPAWLRGRLLLVLESCSLGEAIGKEGISAARTPTSDVHVARGEPLPDLSRAWCDGLVIGVRVIARGRVTTEDIDTWDPA